MRSNSFCRLLAVPIAAGLLTLGTAAHGQSFNLSAVPTGTGWYFGISESARVISANTPYEITVRESGGTRENAIRIGRGEVDLAFTEALVAYELYNGIGRFEDEHNPEFRMLFTIAQSTMHWAVGADTDIMTVEDLEGHPFNPSTIGGGGEYITEQVFNVLGIQPDYQRMRLSDAAEAVVDGRIVGLSYNAIPPNPSFTEVHSNRPLRLLEISDEQFAAVSSELPFLAQTVVPADTYTGMPDTQTIGIFMSVGANADLPEDVAYEMTKAFWENHEEVAGAFPAAQGVTPEVAVAEATYPLHAGAARYYQELGIEIPDDVMPPEM
jgi:uncharacterized protein